MRSASEATARKNETYLTLYIPVAVFLNENVPFKCNFDVYVRYRPTGNRIFAYCVPTLCVLRSV